MQIDSVSFVEVLNRYLYEIHTDIYNLTYQPYFINNKTRLIVSPFSLVTSLNSGEK